ncbi:hypothetical protein ANO14919_113660 [Xylariales sp. No.14919]|nr:hypothetical protein ANO14919_113660 [Xylariales sp. No.14919]
MTPTPQSQPNLVAESIGLTSKQRGKPFVRFMRCIKGLWKEADADFSTQWPLFPLILWFFFLVTILAILIKLSIFPQLVHACRPDGTFSPYEGYSYWDASGIFQINLTLGSYSFTAAKIIDTVWDLVVGRLGQAILGYVSWCTFADYATISMETTPMTYAMFVILFTEGGPKVTSIYRLARDVVRYHRPRSRVSVAWVIFSMLFVLAWPTIISSMSGYTPEMWSYVRDISDNLVPYNEFELLVYIIHDGDRVNLTANYLVLATPLYESVEALLSNVDGSLSQEPEFLGIYCAEFYPGVRAPELCSLYLHIYDYAITYGFGGRSRTSSQWQNYTIPPNSLNIEPYVVPRQLLRSLNKTENFRPAWVSSLFVGAFHTFSSL